MITEIKVIPKDWATNPKTVNSDWTIWFRYNGKLQTKRGMNREKDHSKRVVLTRSLIDELATDIYKHKYNPITKVYGSQEGNRGMIFSKALDYALSQIKATKEMRNNIISALKYIKAAMVKLEFDTIPINMIGKRHLRQLLNQVQVDREFSNRSWNAYRTYLLILFTLLEDDEYIEANPVSSLKKVKQSFKLRRTLEDEQRETIKVYLQKKDPAFYNFIQIFFHSGGRRKELMELKVQNVNLEKQYYIVTVKKGDTREVIKVIKDVALPYWKEVIGNHQSGYVFSVGLVPGPKKILANQPTRRWWKLVKRDLKIKCDMYSLKHLNTDETSEALNIEEAAKHNNHDVATAKKFYAINYQLRELEKIKKIQNKL